MSKYYKVVRRTPVGLGSVSAGSYQVAEPSHRVIYTPNQTVRPTIAGSKLFVFKTYEHAVAFAEERTQRYELEIWECKVTNPVAMKFRTWVRVKEMEKFWAARSALVAKHISTRRIAQFDKIANAPEGSYGVSSVRLTNKTAYLTNENILQSSHH